MAQRKILSLEETNHGHPDIWQLGDCAKSSLCDDFKSALSHPHEHLRVRSVVRKRNELRWPLEGHAARLQRGGVGHGAGQELARNDNGADGLADGAPGGKDTLDAACGRGGSPWPAESSLESLWHTAAGSPAGRLRVCGIFHVCGWERMVAL